MAMMTTCPQCGMKVSDARMPAHMQAMHKPPKKRK